MSRKTQNVYEVTPSGGQALSASFTTSPTLIKFQDNCSYQIIATTNDAIGSFIVEASLDFAIYEPSDLVTNPGHWTSLTLSGTPALAGANDTILINLNQLPFTAIRLTYTRTSGSNGTARVYVATRMV